MIEKDLIIISNLLTRFESIKISERKKMGLPKISSEKQFIEVIRPYYEAQLIVIAINKLLDRCKSTMGMFSDFKGMYMIDAIQPTKAFISSISKQQKTYEKLGKKYEAELQKKLPEIFPTEFVKDITKFIKNLKTHLVKKSVSKLSYSIKLGSGTDISFGISFGIGDKKARFNSRYTWKKSTKKWEERDGIDLYYSRSHILWGRDGQNPQLKPLLDELKEKESPYLKDGKEIKDNNQKERELLQSISLPRGYEKTPMSKTGKPELEIQTRTDYNWEYNQDDYNRTEFDELIDKEVESDLKRLKDWLSSDLKIEPSGRGEDGKWLFYRVSVK